MKTLYLLAIIQYSYSSDSNINDYNENFPEKQINLNNFTNNINNNIIEKAQNNINNNPKLLQNKTKIFKKHIEIFKRKLGINKEQCNEYYYLFCDDENDKFFKEAEEPDSVSHPKYN